MTKQKIKVIREEMLQVANNVAQEKSIDQDSVFEAMEMALEKAARVKYGFERDIRVSINRDSGDIKLNSYLEVVAKLSEEEQAKQITLDEAKKIQPNITTGEFIIKELPPIDMGRVAAQNAKGVIIQKVREADKSRQFSEYKDKVGEIAVGVVKRTEFGNLIVDLGKNEAIIKREELIPRETFQNGDRVRAYIYDVKEDIKDIVEQLNEAGYPFKLDWFDPFFEFRFPLYGLVDIKDMKVELRAAIEPWNVLGEEMTGGGTSRYVDSSLERVQIKVSNFNDERYVLTCNGVKVQLSNTGVKGEYVAGVRYKAWQPWSALHPTIPVDTPLVFDIVDLWNQRSIDGCTYFVSHPGGRNYETYPINSLEAESRRINRFWDIGHTQGNLVYTEKEPDTKLAGRTLKSTSSEKTFNFKEIPVNPEFPHLLDLRKK